MSNKMNNRLSNQIIVDHHM